MKGIRRYGRALLLSAAVVLGTGAIAVAAAQDSSFIPIMVSVASTVKVEPKVAMEGAETVTLSLAANTVDTIRIPYLMTTGVTYFGARRQAAALSVVVGGNGNITLNLSAQRYGGAEVALYTVGGKRVLRGGVSSLNAVNVLSRGNVAAGAYILSVTGADGRASASRITHNGGGMNIKAVFGDVGGSASDGRTLSKKAEEVALTWTVTVSAEGYADSVYTLVPVVGNNPVQDITLEEAPPEGGASYRSVSIWGKNWMAENLNIKTADSWCYDDNPINCAKYGRLYAWSAAKAACPAGWHLPSRDEVYNLVMAAGGAETAGKALKSTSGWNGNGNGTDDYGFKALPGGFRHVGGSFDGEGGNASMWTATEYDVGAAWFGGITYNNDSVSGEPMGKEAGLSVRCVAD